MAHTYTTARWQIPLPLLTAVVTELADVGAYTPIENAGGMFGSKAIVDGFTGPTMNIRRESDGATIDVKWDAVSHLWHIFCNKYCHSLVYIVHLRATPTWHSGSETV